MAEEENEKQPTTTTSATVMSSSDADAAQDYMRAVEVLDEALDVEGKAVKQAAEKLQILLAGKGRGESRPRILQKVPFTHIHPLVAKGSTNYGARNSGVHGQRSMMRDFFSNQTRVKAADWMNERVE